MTVSHKMKTEFERQLRRPVVLLFFIITFMMLVLPHEARPQEIMRIGTGLGPAYSNSENTGIADVFITELHKRAGFAVEIVRVPTARSLALANNGVLDGELFRIQLNQDLASNLISVPVPILQMRLFGITVDPAIQLPDRASFRDHRLGVVRGWAMTEKYFSDHPSLQEVREGDHLMKMLIAGRIDVAFWDPLRLQEWLVENAAPPTYSSDFTFQVEVFTYVHRSHDDKIEPLADALREMQLDGTVARILRPMIDVMD